jgi:hypothetical protein
MHYALYTNVGIHKMKRLPILILFIVIRANCQDFQEAYIEKMSSSWKVYESPEFESTIDPKMDSLYQKVNGKGYKESLIEKQKESVNEQAAHLAQIFEFLDLDIDEQARFSLIEEKSLNISPPIDIIKKGVIIAYGTAHGYRFDPESKTQKFETFDYSSETDNLTLNQARQIIMALLLQERYEDLRKIAQVESEMLAGPLKELQPKTEFEVIQYNKNGSEKLRLFYLHETFVQIMNQ